MAGIIKVNQIQDFNGNTLLTSDGNGNLTTQDFNKPAFSAWLSGSDQSIAQNTVTTLIADTEFFDTDSAYDTSTGKFTVPNNRQGMYFFNAGFTMSSNYDLVQAFIYINDSARFRGTVVRNDASTMTVSAIINLNVGDEVTARAYQSNASNSFQAGGDTSNPTRYMSYFSGFRIGS
jgi:hypothetical protein|tara:strand:+ start:325 stop:852 length:528 start_codon:yes stop_codon:yes gene_type:complete